MPGAHTAIGSALREHIGADTELVQCAFELIGRRSLEQMLGLVRGKQIAFLIRAVFHVLAEYEGVGRRKLPVGQEGATDLRVKPATAYLSGRLVTGAVGRPTAGRLIGNRVGTVLLSHVERGHRRIQAAVEVLTLDTDFVAFTGHRVQHRATDILLRLRLEDLGVAGVDRVGVVQVIDHTGVGGDFLSDLVVANRRAVIVVVPTDPTTDDDMQRVQRVEARRGVDALFRRRVLAFIEAIVAASARRLGNDARIEIVDVDGRGVVPVATGLVELLLTAARTDGQLMLPAEELEGASQGGIHIGLHVGGVVGTCSLPVDAIARCRQVAGKGVGLRPDLRGGSLGRPTVVEAMGDISEYADVVPIPIRPVVAQERGARQVQVFAIRTGRQTAPVRSRIVTLLGSAQGPGRGIA